MTNMAEVMRKDLLERLKSDYPKLRFREGKKFAFRPPRTVFYEAEQLKQSRQVEPGHPEQPVGLERADCSGQAELQLLHELGHAVLEHKNFRTDLERLKMEVAAWAEARKFCEQYNIYYDEEFVEGQLDSYRDWLHAKSRCPRCGLTRYQTPNGQYHCPGCEL